MDYIDEDSIDFLTLQATEHGKPNPLDGGVEYILKLKEEPPRARDVVITYRTSDDEFNWFLRCEVYGKDPQKNRIGAVINGLDVENTRCYKLFDGTMKIGDIKSFNSVMFEIAIAVVDAYNGEGHYPLHFEYPLEFNNTR